jgi:hypothetical protein
MEHKPALYALVRLHAELGYKIKANRTEADNLRADMQHVEAVLRLLEPGFDTRRIAAKRKNNPNPLYKRGTIFRAVLSILRTAAGPMTADEITLALFKSKGVPEPSREDRRRMWGAVSASLGNHEGKTVEAIEGRPRRWRVILSKDS